jgi:hypothetical protein
MKLIIEFDKENLLSLLRNFGLALTLGGFFFGSLQKGDLKTATTVVIIGVIFALTGSLRKIKWQK